MMSGLLSNERSTSPRRHRKVVPVYSFGQMHAFAAAAGGDEAMVRVLSDCGLRLGELLGLERRDFDGQVLEVRGSAHDGVFIAGDQPTKRHGRTVPVSAALARLLAALPARIDTPLLFRHAGTGGELAAAGVEQGPLWQGRGWGEGCGRRQAAALPDMQAATPHSFRHSSETQLHAAGIDPADLPAMAGHSIRTMQAHYVHALNVSLEAARRAVG